MKQTIRVRFAPSPTGYMHLGNVRAALMNALFAKRYNGKLILRIEDTDQKRNTAESFQAIINDLSWLGLYFHEGPHVGGSFGPYLQSERSAIYQEALEELITHQKAYRCFCTQQDLERKRELQLQQSKPPRYDRTCLLLSQEKIKQKVAFGKPFIWRLKINERQTLPIHDMAKGTINFDMQHFSDFAITRQDGSVTFVFANFVDDWRMHISHVIRGQDHLSNTAYQAALYDAFAVKAPTFWHLPIICNSNGEKMSKRDFGFALKDLQENYLPEAILNYLGTLGFSLKEEILSLEELARQLPLDAIPSGGNISYTPEKLLWFNHQWINKLPVQELIKQVLPLLQNHYPQITTIPQEEVVKLIVFLQPEAKTLGDFITLSSFYFSPPHLDINYLEQHIPMLTLTTIITLLTMHKEKIVNAEHFLSCIKAEAKQLTIPMKFLMQAIRYLLTGSLSGFGIQELLTLLAPEKITERLTLFEQAVKQKQA